MKRKKNGFTLIELLAVIVILAIIALIATPIILGIVEDARKDSFERSVELVISTTDLDVSNKNIQEGYKYEIVDGNVSNLEVGIKNTQGMNGEIYYDETGNSVYAIHNGVYCVKKTATMEKAEISDYVEGECIAKEDQSVFATITKMVPNENDVLVSTNGQLKNFGEYGIRYQGLEPDNYVYFNCSDYSNQSDETCEVWRIFGIVDGKVKIIKNESIGNMHWNCNDINGDGDCYDEGEDENNWADATLKTYLNSDYYNSLTTKNALTGNMISPSTWHLIAIPIVHATSSPADVYTLERNVGSGCEVATGSIICDSLNIGGTVLYDTPKIDNVNIGLLYPSDLLFSALPSDSCMASGFYVPCATNTWIESVGRHTWFITPIEGSNSTAMDFLTENYGINQVYIAEENVRNLYDVTPTLYLSSEVEIKEGQGTSTLPYQLQINE